MVGLNCGLMLEHGKKSEERIYKQLKQSNTRLPPGIVSLFQYSLEWLG